MWAPFPSVSKDKAYPEAAIHSLSCSPRASARSWRLAAQGCGVVGVSLPRGLCPSAHPPNTCDSDSGPARLPPAVWGKPSGDWVHTAVGTAACPRGDSPSLATSPMGTLCFWAMYPRKEKTTKPEEKLVRELTEVVMTASLGDKTHVPATRCGRGNSLPLSSMRPVRAQAGFGGCSSGGSLAPPQAAP